MIDFFSLWDFFNDTIYGSFASDSCELVPCWSVTPKCYSTLLKMFYNMRNNTWFCYRNTYIHGQRNILLTLLISMLCHSTFPLTIPFSIKFFITDFNNSWTIIWIVELIPFRFIWVSNKVTIPDYSWWL